VTIQIPQLEQTEPRLLTDSTNLRQTDASFDEKLRREQARLGLLFSPFSQLSGFFAGSLSFDFSEARAAGENSLPEMAEEAVKPSTKTPDTAQQPNLSTRQASVQLFDSLPLANLNRQVLQDLLTQTNWLVPNLQAQPLFFNAAVNGQLRQSFDLQALIDQIALQVKMVKSKGTVQFSLTLQPEELGQVILTLTAHAGLISVDLQALSGTRKLLDTRRAELEKALAKADVHFDRITIREVPENA
jgi:flagellar hook-length control protein FliK